MPLTLDNIIQQDIGNFSGSSGNATLPAGTQAGNAVVIIVGLLGDNASGGFINAPAGFTQVKQASTFLQWNDVGVFIKPSASADETSWALTVGGGGGLQTIWAVLEMSDLDLDWPAGDIPYKWTYLSGTETAAATIPSGTTGVSETFDGVAVAAFFATSTDTNVPAFSSYDNGFFEIAERSAATSPNACAMALAAKAQQVVGPVSCTASVSPNSYGGALMLVFTGLDSHHAANLTAIFGAEVGTATGLTSAVDGPAPFDAVTGTPEIVTTHPRSGSYALKLSASAAAENVRWLRQDAPRGTLGTTTDNPVTMWTKRLHFYFEDLPAADTELFFAEVGSHANGLVGRYVSATQKIGVKIGSGSEVLSDAAIAADQYFGVDIEYDPRTTTHTCRWAVDYDATVGDTTGGVAQTTASTAGMTAGGVTAVGIGSTAAATFTVWVDDIGATRHRKTYPIDDIQVLPIKVDPAGTPSVSGSSTNFRTFTNNGTLATWTAAGTRTALDDIPPTIGASADGLAQITVALTDYVLIPMETFTGAPDYALMGGRWYWAGWASSGNPGNIQFKPDDGVTEFATHIGSATDCGFDDTSLIWTTYIHNPSPTQESAYALTQSKMNALAAKFGFSADANPDCGIHCVLFELVVQPAIVYGVMSGEDGAFNVYVRQDRRSGAVVSYLGTTPPGTRGMTMYGTVDAVDWTQYVDPNTTYEKAIGADSIANVTAIGMTPDPTE